MSPIKRPVWTTTPLLVAYLIVVSTTIGLLVNRTPAEAVPTMAAPAQRAEVREREAEEPPLWLQLFRPSPPTAGRLLRAALPSLPLRRQAEKDPQNLLILWTGRAGDRPQSLFQVMLPFLRPQNQVTQEPTTPPPSSDPPKTGPGANQPGGVGAGRPGASGTSRPGPEGTAGGQGSGKPGTSPQPGQSKPDAKPPQSVAINGGLPLVGIYHTHDWESYLSEFPNLKVENEEDLGRIASYDHSERTVINIGESMAHRLRDLGVTTVHAPFSHQDQPYDYAYQSSRETAKKILRTAPSVKLLFDLHRDGTWGLDSTTEVDGKPVARMRCVIGAREDHPKWEQNKRFCDDLIAAMEKAHPGLTLPTITKEYRFNQDLLPGAILLEIGNATNRYEEAERAVGYLAEAVVELVKAGKYPK